MSVTKEQVLEFFDNMTVLDMSKFVKEFEERYGITAAAPVAMAAAIGAAGAPAAAAEEKTSFDVILASVGDKKIQVIK
ncbi:large subunit ribosomal protein L7/L12, partial [Candidatus Hakubella thermalkaliphila]